MKKFKVFYGWWIVVVSFLCMMTMGGVGFYAFPLFYEPLQTEFGWSRGAISIAYTTYMVVGAFLAPLIGSMVDRYGSKRAIVIGAIICGLGYVWLSSMHNLWEFYAAHILVGVGLRSFGMIPITKLVSNWFSKRRGTALGITTSSFGLGGLILAPAVGAYVIPTYGWQGAYLTLAISTWVLIIPASILVLKSKPSDIGLYPDGVKPVENIPKVELKEQALEGFTTKTALITSTFWLITTAFLISNFSHMGLMQHQVIYLTDIGYASAIASTALGAVGLASATAKLVTGWLCDRMQAKYVATLCFFFKTAAILVMILIKPTSPLTVIWLYAIFMGIGVGGWTTALSILISGNFGLAYYGAIMGMFTMISGSFSAFGPLVAGYTYDVTGTYLFTFGVFLALSSLSIPLMLLVRRPKRTLLSS